MVTLGLVTGGQILKMFSLYNQVWDPMAMTISAVGFICNSTLFAQTLIYGDREAAMKKAG
jgi:hypothetical protein